MADLPNLSFDIIANDQFSDTFNSLRQQSKQAEQAVSKSSVNTQNNQQVKSSVDALSRSYKDADASARKMTQNTKALAMAQERLDIASRSTAQQIRYYETRLSGMNRESLEAIRLQTLLAKAKEKLGREEKQGPGLASLVGGGIKGAAFALGGASVASYAAYDFSRRALEFGREGASILQLSRSFEMLNDAISSTSSTLLNDLRRATQNTVSDNILIAETNLLLSASQQQGIQITNEEIAALARLARSRSTQLALGGKQISAQEAYARIIRGGVKRESELLDELGLSTKQLADALGVSNDEVTKSTETMIRALIAVSDIEFNTFGEPVLDEATKIQQAEKRITDAVNRIKKASAEPVAFSYDLFAGVVEAVLPNPDVSDVVRELQNTYTSILQDWSKGTGGRGMNSLYGELGMFMSDAVPIGRMSPDDVSQMQELVSLSKELMDISKEIQWLRMTGMITSAYELEQSWQRITNDLISGRRNVEQVTDAAERLSDEMTKIQHFMNYITPQTRMWGNAMMGVANAAAMIAAIGPSADLLFRSLDPESQLMQIQAELNALRQLPEADVDPERVRQLRDAQFGAQEAVAAQTQSRIDAHNAAVNSYNKSMRSTEEQLAYLRQELVRVGAETTEGYRIRTEINSLEKQLAKSVTDTTEAVKDFGKSLKDLISNIPGIPGVTGLSEVTDLDMQLSKLGLYQEKPDERIRQAFAFLNDGSTFSGMLSRDDIVNLVSASMGYSPEQRGALAGAPNDILSQLLGQEFESGRLFGTTFGREMFPDLFNAEAMGRELARAQQAEMGTEFVMGQIDPFGDTATAESIRNSFANAVTNLALASEFTSAFQNQFASDDVNNAFLNVGEEVGRTVMGGLTTVLSEGEDVEAVQGLFRSALEGPIREIIIAAIADLLP